MQLANLLNCTFRPLVNLVSSIRVAKTSIPKFLLKMDLLPNIYRFIDHQLSRTSVDEVTRTSTWRFMLTQTTGKDHHHQTHMCRRTSASRDHGKASVHFPRGLRGNLLTHDTLACLPVGKDRHRTVGFARYLPLGASCYLLGNHCFCIQPPRVERGE